MARVLIVLALCLLIPALVSSARPIKNPFLVVGKFYRDNFETSATTFIPSWDNELRQPLSRKVPISSSMINPYRVIILFRLVILAFFLRYRLTHPVENAHGLWLASVLCEGCFALFWILDQLPKLHPVNRETYPERLCLRYN
ncbi:hypothetical protein NE237_013327 [Protea cynaroides]|uniref:Uncharacterized protein n=1 Tax=Protea cynaroides TaxID=273540 RepID=A0A9Q0H3N8_9MAGN|nr:hypothetical protein NE237_013327 [Protea cynaroides]